MKGASRWLDALTESIQIDSDASTSAEANALRARRRLGS
jgi:hypothetical protein